MELDAKCTPADACPLGCLHFERGQCAWGFFLQCKSRIISYACVPLAGLFDSAKMGCYFVKRHWVAVFVRPGWHLDIFNQLHQSVQGIERVGGLLSLLVALSMKLVLDDLYCRIQLLLALG